MTEADPRWHGSGYVHFDFDISDPLYVIRERSTGKFFGRFTGINTWHRREDAERYLAGRKIDGDVIEVRLVPT